ncbi:hypothetical protein [Arthrobacter sp. 2MCAF14]|uniref:hypothetical protein n=1 Tax=Arthrobacter sp. 2MCAF14 TaxID=3232982 RepID=UPI003F904246
MSILSRRTARRSAAGATALSASGPALSAPAGAAALSAPVMWAVGAVAVVGLVATGTGVYAALNAQASNGSPQTVSSGVMFLTMANSGVGFSQAISNLAPGDIANRYVTLNSLGNLDAKNLTLAASDSTPSLLTTSATKGLQVTVSQCTVPWTTTTGACSGTTTPLGVAGTPLSTITSATPEALGASTLSAGSSLNLKVSVTLPDQTETTTNGTPPMNTIQGQSSSLTWTFGETQRTATTTNN